MMSIFWYPVEAYGCFEFSSYIMKKLLQSSFAAHGYFVSGEMLIAWWNGLGYRLFCLFRELLFLTDQNAILALFLFV